MLFIYSLLALFFWSGSDLFTKVGTQLEDRNSHWKVGAAVGLIMGCNALYSILFQGVTVSFDVILLYLPASFFYIASMIVGYLGLRYIELSVSSPICNTSGAFALLFSLFYFGVTFVEEDSDRIFMNPTIIVGVVLIFLGILFLGIVDQKEDDDSRLQRQMDSSRKYRKSFLAILLPIIYCLLDAVGTFLDTIIANKYTNTLVKIGVEDAEDVSGNVLNCAYNLTWFVVGVVCLIYLLIKKEKPSAKYDLPKLAGGLCETIGQIFYMMVVVSEYKVGLVIISAYCGLSMVWSRIFLKEKLSKLHYITLSFVLIGIVLLGIEGV